LLLKKTQGELNVLKRDKWIFYTGKATEEIYKEKGSFDVKLNTKDDQKTFIEADKEYRELKGKVEYYETVVDYLQEIVKSISNRSFQIKNAIEWRKFEAGI
jgi:ribosomal protein L7/L12